MTDARYDRAPGRYALRANLDRARAPQAAGVIHTDFERGFIKAEVIRWDDLLRYGSEAAAKSRGAMRVEGRDYVVQDGDVMHFRFAT